MQPPKIEKFTDLFHLSDYKETHEKPDSSLSLQASSHTVQGVKLKPVEHGGLIVGTTALAACFLHQFHKIMSHSKHPAKNQ